MATKKIMSAPKVPSYRAKKFKVKALGRDLFFTKRASASSSLPYRARCAFECVTDGLTLVLYVLKPSSYYGFAAKKDQRAGDTWMMEVFHGDVKVQMHHHENPTPEPTIEATMKTALEMSGKEQLRLTGLRDECIKRLVATENDITKLRVLDTKLIQAQRFSKLGMVAAKKR